MVPFFILDDYLTFLGIEKRYSSHTLSSYQTDLSQFQQFLSSNDVTDYSLVNTSNIRRWLVHLHDTHCCPRSINRKLTAIRTFYQWLCRKGYVIKNPAKNLRGLKTGKSLPVFARESEMELSRWDGVFPHNFYGLRDRIMIELFYQTGLRRSELIQLKCEDISNDCIRVIGKGNKERIIPISAALNILVQQYAQARRAMEYDNKCFIVLNNGKELYPKFVNRKIKQYLSITTNMEKKSPHVLRHTFATHLLNRGAGLETIKELLGHSNLSATQVYTHNTFAKLTSIYAHAHPRGIKNK
jgi:integrase/recombinase XerC